MDNYKNGPEGMPRVKRMSDSTLDTLISKSLFNFGLEGETLDRLHSLMHAVAEETLARVPKWSATPASSATSGEAVIQNVTKKFHDRMMHTPLLPQDFGITDPVMVERAKNYALALAAYPAAAPESAQQGGTKREAIKQALDELSSLSPDELQAELDSHRGNLRLELPSAQQGEDEPPLPHLSLDDQAAVMALYDKAIGMGGSADNIILNTVRLAVAHMMRKLGDGVSVDTPEFRKLLAAVQGWHDGEPVMEGDAQELIAHIDAKLAQARAAGADIDKLRDDLAWYKESLKRHSSKLDSVWEGIRKAVQKYSGKPCDGEPFDRLDELLSSLTSAAGAERKYTQDEMERFGLHVRDAALERIAAGAERAVPEGWTIKRMHNGTIIVRKDDVGGCATRQGAPDIVLNVLWALANDLLSAPSPAAANEGKAMTACFVCNGTGYRLKHSGAGTYMCGQCHGSGQIPVIAQQASAQVDAEGTANNIEKLACNGCEGNCERCPFD